MDRPVQFTDVLNSLIMYLSSCSHLTVLKVILLALLVQRELDMEKKANHELAERCEQLQLQVRRQVLVFFVRTHVTPLPPYTIRIYDMYVQLVLHVSSSVPTYART